MENLYDLIVENSRGLRKLGRKLAAARKAHRRAGGGPVTPELYQAAKAEDRKRLEGQARAENSSASRKAARKAQDRADARAHETDVAAAKREQEGLPSTPMVTGAGGPRRGPRRGR